MNYSPHSFHIPVMGLAYTIDTPIKVARFGISSVISIVENRLVEMMREHYHSILGLHFTPITRREPDHRAKRITAYLDLVNDIVKDQVVRLRNEAFEKGNDIVRYFEMLPAENPVKQMYLQMVHTEAQKDKLLLQAKLREQIAPGSIDVNIMTKPDRENFDSQGNLLENGSDAVAALRGYAKSKLSGSSVVFSAGMNPRLFNYLAECPEFDMDEAGRFAKKVVVKVSDYRSALIQGKYLAKKGVWVSEFRIESGLNCGGHAFATEGFVMGPILEEFRYRRQELIDSIFEVYKPAVFKKTEKAFINPPGLVISAQGGIGNHLEDRFMREHYQLHSTGWGTPFLLVPEATTVDDETLRLLAAAKEPDVFLSKNSPLGARFYYLRNTSGEKEKIARINMGKPGSPCIEKHLESNTEFTKEPICTASHKYQKLKIAHLQGLAMPSEEYEKQLAEVLAKECLCVGLSNAAAIKHSRVFIKNRNAVNVCPGPNIINFSRVVSLRTMTDHIYGRDNIITNPNRPHMFITELNLYIDYLREQLQGAGESTAGSKKKFASFLQNLHSGITYYRGLPCKYFEKDFRDALDFADLELHALDYQFNLTADIVPAC